MAKLRDLDAHLVGQYDPTADSFHYLPNLDGAQGVWFLCPLCGHHMVLCWFTNPRNAAKVPDDATPGPGRWEASGTGLDDLTLTPSVNLDTQSARDQHSCLWHGWVRSGSAQ